MYNARSTAAGASLTDVVSVIVYLADIDDWGRFNTAYKELMPSPYPTRTALGANLRGILVEISAVAYVGEPVRPHTGFVPKFRWLLGLARVEAY